MLLKPRDLQRGRFLETFSVDAVVGDAFVVQLLVLRDDEERGPFQPSKTRRRIFWNVEGPELRSSSMSASEPVLHAPGQASVLEKIDSAGDLRHRLARLKAQVRDNRRRGSARAAAVAADLQKHPGYYPAAVARNKELLNQYAERPDLNWGMLRWAEIFDRDGLPWVLKMLAHPHENQELLSCSPFYLMRPPLPENDFYRSHVSSKTRH